MKPDFYAHATPIADSENITTNELEMPFGFEMHDDGLYYRPATKDDDEGTPFKVCTPVSIKFRVRDPQDNYGAIIEYLDRDGRTMQRFFPDTLLHKRAGDLAAHLAEAGMKIVTKSYAREALQTFLNEATAPFAVYAQQSGWMKTTNGEDAFVMPSGEVIGADSIIMRPDAVMKACVPNGTLKDWQDGVAWYARDNHRMTFAISSAFAAPLMHQQNVPSGGFHFYGFSQTGKTTLLCTAASVTGMGSTKGGYVESWKGTDNAMEAVAARHNDLLLPLDEMSQAPDKALDQIIYQIGNGAGKSRMNRDGSLRATREWCALSLSTGEEKAEDMIKRAGKKANAGTDVRLANVPSMADDSQYGVFDCIHEFHCGKDLSDHLRKASKQYYGTAIRAFLAEYILHKHAYDETIDAKCREFIKTHLPADAAGQAFSVAHRFALSAVAGELATDFGVVPWDKGFATEAASVCLQAWLGDRGFTGLAETEKLVAYTRKYLGAYQTGRFIDPDCHNHTVPLLTGYKKLEDGRVDFYILPDQLDTIVPGVSEKQWVQAMDKAGFLIREESRATPKYRLRVSHGLERDTEDEGGIGRPPHYIQRHSRVATYRISGSILSGGLPHEEVGAGSVD